MIRAKKTKDVVGNVWIWCPGCESHHILAVDAPNSFNARWGFNNDFEKPTFTPSLLVQWNEYSEEHREIPVHKVCHSFITDGKIKFLDDCTHALKGQEVELPDVDIASFQI